MQKCLEETNAKVISKAQTIRKYKILESDFSIDGGELTPTMKLKRKFTETKYKAFVEQMYEDPKL